MSHVGSHDGRQVVFSLVHMSKVDAPSWGSALNGAAWAVLSAATQRRLNNAMASRGPTGWRVSGWLRRRLTWCQRGKEVSNNNLTSQTRGGGRGGVGVGALASTLVET